MVVVVVVLRPQGRKNDFHLLAHSHRFKKNREMARVQGLLSLAVQIRTITLCFLEECSTK